MEQSSKELPFLDILIKKNWQIITDIYYERTDTQQYLHEPAMQDTAGEAGTNS